MAEQTEDKALQQDIIGPGFTALLADPGKGRYWLAIVDGETAGQIMITCEWGDWRNETHRWIQSDYVTSPCRAKGVFSAMDKHVESQAKADDGACGLRLDVDKGNHRAQKTCQTPGMKKTGYLVIELNFATQGET